MIWSVRVFRWMVELEGGSDFEVLLVGAPGVWLVLRMFGKSKWVFREVHMLDSSSFSSIHHL